MACFPSSHWVGASVIKNWDPFVSGPELAIDKIPAPEIVDKISENTCGEYKDSMNRSQYK